MLTDFNLPHLPEGLLAPLAELVIDINKTTVSSNETFYRGMSPAQINEALQESLPMSPNKNPIGNLCKLGEEYAESRVSSN